MKATLVSQDQRSSYRVTEASVGGALARHDLSILQVGGGGGGVGGGGGT